MELLEGAGAWVKVTANGLEAVAVLSADADHPFDLVLMDLQMPEMDGYQATAKLRADPRWKEMPIIAMTAHATVEERERCLRAGMNDHIAKPIDPALLFQTVAKYYKRRADGKDVSIETRSDGTSGAIGVELPNVAGLDAQQGLARLGGNRKLYRKLLRQFVDEQRTVPDGIGSALAEGNLDLAQRLAHTLKGVAGNIGASAVHNTAGLVEKAMRDHAEPAALAEARAQLAAALQPLVSDLQAALSCATAGDSTPPPPAAPLSPAEALRDATELSALLAAFDAGASDFLASHEAGLRRFFAQAAWPEFAQRVNDYNFAEARAQLDAALAHHKSA